MSLAIQVTTILIVVTGALLLWVFLRHYRQLKAQALKLQIEAQLREKITAPNVLVDKHCPPGRVYIMSPRDAASLGINVNSSENDQ